jgi:hypothetical protein
MHMRIVLKRTSKYLPNRHVLSAVCHLLLQSDRHLAPHLEQQLKQQIGSLLRVALTVGESALRPNTPRT